MVDLTRYKTSILAASDKTNNAPAEDHSGMFADYLFLLGYKPGAITHGAITRIPDSADNGTKMSGWYIYHQGEAVSVGVYGSWRKPDDKGIWYSKNENSLNFAERVHLASQIKEAQERQKAEREKIQQEAADAAYAAIQTLPDATTDNPYIKRKKIKVFRDVKTKGDNLIIPVTLAGAITSLQTIRPDGTKRFKVGGKTKGCYFKLEGDESIIYIAEGYATAASIAEATGNAVYVAFSAHNLFETWLAIRELYNKIVICGDNDQTCIAKCQQIQCESIFPPSTYNDFNDWWVAEGENMIKSFARKPGILTKETVPEDHDFVPSGVIAQIVSYYNATARKAQPLFAIQCAIATCSVILARNFTTDYDNHTNLFLINVAKSGTGKEHAKTICEKILEATDNQYLIAGDGYTSQSAVVCACINRPRHITIIDEFSKYLQACQNSNSGGHMAEANSTLMQVINRSSGTLRPKERSTFSLTHSQKKELRDQYVVFPAITLLAMTTPEDFFSTINTTAIKDGFINRFLICISNEKREMPVDKEPMQVPETIIEWDREISIRRGQSDESPILAPKQICIPFSPESAVVRRDFQKYCLDMADKLERFGLAEVVGRSAEMSYKLSLIIALSENPHAEKIGEDHAQQAVNWIKFNLERLINELKTSVSSSKHEGIKKEILKALRSCTNGITLTEMFKRPPFSKYERKILHEVLSELQDAELATREVEQREGVGNRKTIWKAI